MTAIVCDPVCDTRRPVVAHLDMRPLGQNRTLLITPTGACYEVDAPSEQVTHLLLRCDGTRTAAQITAGLDREGEWHEVLALLLDQGCLTTARPPDGLHAFHLILVGDRDLCLACEAQAVGWGRITRLPPGTLPDVADPAHSLVVALADHIDGATLTAINRHCAAAGVRWTQFHLDRGKGFLGPLVVPGRTADYEDLLARRRCSGDDVEGAQLKPPVVLRDARPHLPRPGHTALHWMLSTLLCAAETALTGRPCRLYSAELEADPHHHTLHHRPFLPLPTRAPSPADWLTGAVTAEQALVGARAGIVLSRHVVPHHPSMPRSLVTVRAHCTDLSRVYAQGNDLYTGGSSFGDEPAAQGAALGEALERYCGNCLPGVATVYAAYGDLVARGRRALDPERLVLHSASMLGTPGCPFVPFTRELPVHWVPGRSLTYGAPCLLPLSMVYANWRGGELTQPDTHYMYTPGMAAGTDLERALVGAVRELVERDITMVWWHNAHPLPGVKPTPALEALWHDVADPEAMRVRYIHLDNPFDIPVIAAVVEHLEHGFLNIGFGCRPRAEDAARKALTEALTLQEGSRDLVRPDSTLRRCSEEWQLLHVPYRPYRADRRYMDAFRHDYRDVDDLMLQQQFYLDPRAVEAVRPFLLDPPELRRFADLPSLPTDDLAAYRRPIEAAGFEILYADITSPDVALTPYRVVRMIIPGLVPNMPAAFPAVGGSRVFDLPVTLGWRRRPLDEARLHYFPMPHA